MVTRAKRPLCTIALLDSRATAPGFRKPELVQNIVSLGGPLEPDNPRYVRGQREVLPQKSWQLEFN